MYDYSKKNVSYIIHQPDLRTKFIEKINNENEYILGNTLIWGKLIKKELFKKVLNI